GVGAGVGFQHSDHRACRVLVFTGRRKKRLSAKKRFPTTSAWFTPAEGLTR
ncbi:hypothetical protein U1Q18_012992, partial [Sarracenia purpurea var. burkii]